MQSAVGVGAGAGGGGGGGGGVGLGGSSGGGAASLWSAAAGGGISPSIPSGGGGSASPAHPKGSPGLHPKGSPGWASPDLRLPGWGAPHPALRTSPVLPVAATGAFRKSPVAAMADGGLLDPESSLGGSSHPGGFLSSADRQVPGGFPPPRSAPSPSGSQSARPGTVSLQDRQAPGVGRHAVRAQPVLVCALPTTPGCPSKDSRVPPLCDLTTRKCLPVANAPPPPLSNTNGFSRGFLSPCHSNTWKGAQLTSVLRCSVTIDCDRISGPPLDHWQSPTVWS